MKKRKVFLSLAVALFIAPLVFSAVSPKSKPVEVQASSDFTTGHIVIPVVRPNWWQGGNNQTVQVLRIADSADDLDNNNNTTWISIDGWVGDSNWWADGGNSEYANTGVIFYEVLYSAIQGKYVDLVRYNENNLNERWNKTPSEKFEDYMLHRIWRIWGNGNGIYRPEGTGAESRGASNEVVARVLSGYTTCNSSTINGYSAIKTLDDHYNLGRVWGDTKVHDFASVNHYTTGKGTGIEVPAWEKYQAMLALYNASSGKSISAEPTKDNSLMATVIIGVIGLSTLAGYYFLQRKKAVHD